MKRLLLAGTAGLLFSFGAAGASAQTLYEGDRSIYAAPQQMEEGRAADVDGAAAGVIVHPRYRDIPHPHDDYGQRVPFPTRPQI